MKGTSRRIPGRFAGLVLAALAACGALRLPAQAPAPPQTQTRLAPGVTYLHLQRISPAGEPWSIHVLEIDRNAKSIVLRAVAGHDHHGQMVRELPTAIAFDAKSLNQSVLAAINGDFDLGTPYEGIPIGLSVTSGRLWTTSREDWPAFGVLRSGEPVIGIPAVDIELSAGKLRWRVISLNKPPGFDRERGPRLYTRAFRAAIKSPRPFNAAVIGKLKPTLPLRAGGVFRGVVLSAHEQATRVAIPDDGVVVAESDAMATNEKSSPAALRVGQKVKLRIRVRLGGRERIRDAAGGFPVLVRNGAVNIAGTPGANLRLRHPRTAACYNARQIIFAVVDGRRPQLSVGMTLEELAGLMVSLGCTEAINLDGGGSSEMAVAAPSKPATGKTAPGDLRIMNAPSDGLERGRPNAWVVLRRP